MALSPVQPIATPGTLPPVVTKALAITLTAGIDPITPIINTVTATLTNTATLLSNWIANPFPILATVASNWVAYFNELPDIGAIVSQVFANMGNALEAPFSPGSISPGPATPFIRPPAGIANGDNISAVPFITLVSQKAIYRVLTTTGLLPDQ
ncbi:MAG: hypothetical protein ACOYEV_18560, partial [Candidatus Nanopelagicales bacterium]